jgi:predicted membrane channel-forming protein YqfA (hemolysin III family)
VAKTSNDVRTVARKRLEERRGFAPHLIIYVLINAGLVAIWATTAPDAFFWPVFPLVFWGAGVVMHAWNAFFSRPITESDVDREVERLGAPIDDPHVD